MSLIRWTLAAGVLLACAGAYTVHAAPKASAEELARRAALIQPSADEVRWQQIPWLTSLVEAQRTARQEGRPVFLWVTSDPPLDRC
jgi:hypothetical protein